MHTRTLLVWALTQFFCPYKKEIDKISCMACKTYWMALKITAMKEIVLSSNKEQGSI